MMYMESLQHVLWESWKYQHSVKTDNMFSIMMKQIYDKHKMLH